MAGINVSEAQLDAAVAAGIITRDQAEGVLALAAAPAGGAAAIAPDDILQPDRDDERFRFLNGFNDIFLSIGIVLIMAPLFAIGKAPMSAIVVALVVFVLSEILVKHKRTVLPGIVLATIFAIAFASAAWGFVHMDSLGLGWWWWRDHIYILVKAVALIAAAIGGAIYYARYRLPYALFVIGTSAGLAVVFLALWMLAPPSGNAFQFLTAPFVVIPAFLAGLALFAAAMWFDTSDLERRTRRADCAFWLHLAAAPLLVHPAIAPLIAEMKGSPAGQALAVFLVVAVIALFALAVDRRAVLVASLSYLLGAVTYFTLAPSISLLFVGVLVLVLGLGWHGLRRELLGLIPDGPLKRLLPPPPQDA